MRWCGSQPREGAAEPEASRAWRKAWETQGLYSGWAPTRASHSAAGTSETDCATVISTLGGGGGGRGGCCGGAVDDIDDVDEELDESADDLAELFLLERAEANLSPLRGATRLDLPMS